MRYVLVDQIIELRKGKFLRAIKNITASDELMMIQPTGETTLPATMLLESMAQAAGLLVAASIDCMAQPVLAKVQPFAADGLAKPGDKVELSVELEELRKEGCRARVVASVMKRTLAEATIYLALISPDQAGEGNLLRRAELRRHLADLFPQWFSSGEVTA